MPPKQMQSDLLHRGKALQNQLNTDLRTGSLRLAVEHHKATHAALIDASARVNGVSLGYPAFFKIFKKMLNKSRNYTTTETEGYYCCVIDTAGRRWLFKEKNSRCTCKIAVAHRAQCSHELKCDSSYKKSYFDVRYLYQEKPTFVKRSTERGKDIETGKNIV